MLRLNSWLRPGKPWNTRWPTPTAGEVDLVFLACHDADPDLRDSPANATSGPRAAAIVARTLLGRLGVPDDVAWCAVYLAPDEARWVTGANFAIDGGVTAA
jgi:NAD(P)-dependent dehydrogenase (short-subunit alcohol dehydrogenase family)